jgi:ComF family protein
MNLSWEKGYLGGLRSGKYMNALIKSFIYFLYPAKCRHCEENLDPSRHYICKSCWEQINFIEEPYCQTCGYPLAFANYSGDEKPRDVWFRKARSIANYYEHDQIEFGTYAIEDSPKHPCNRCPKDVKPLFSISSDFHYDLNKGVSPFWKNLGRLTGSVSKKLLDAFEEHNKPLSDKAFVLIEKEDYGWQVKDEQEYIVRKEGDRISIYGFELHSDQDKASDSKEEKPISVVSDAIHLLKYDGKTIMAEPLSKLMINNMPILLNVEDYDLIIPLPIHIKKLRKRGYNQVELIGRRLSKATGIPIDTQSLTKIMDTESQASSSYMKRGINLKGAFDVSDPSKIEGKRVLLIDDVMTTGASMNESAKALVTKGKVKYVDVLTLVRAV